MVSHVLAQAALAGHRPQLLPSFPPALSQPSIPRPSMPQQSHPQPSPPHQFQQPGSFPALSTASAQPLQQHSDFPLLQRLQPAADSATANHAPSASSQPAADSAPPPNPDAELMPSQARRGEVVDADQHRPPDLSDRGGQQGLDSDSDSGIGGACMAAGSVRDSEAHQSRHRNGLVAVSAKGVNGRALQNGSLPEHIMETVMREQDSAMIWNKQQQQQQLRVKDL